MSRVGSKPVTVPDGVTITLANQALTAKGKLGELSMTRILEGTVLELGWAVHSHPSLSEMLKEAALGAQGRTIHM